VGATKQWGYYLGALAAWILVATVAASSIGRIAIDLKPEPAAGQELLFFAIAGAALGLLALALTSGLYRLGAPDGTQYWVVLGSVIYPWVLRPDWFGSLESAAGYLLMLALPIAGSLVAAQLQTTRREAHPSSAGPA
jgi:hypothetical protein